MFGSALVGYFLLQGFGLGWLFIVAVPQYDSAALLAHNSQIAVASVLHKGRNETNLDGGPRYSFDVKGKAYFGRLPSESVQEQFDVHYLITDPSISSVDPEADSRKVRIQVFCLIVLNMSFGVLAVYVGNRMWRKLDRS